MNTLKRKILSQARPGSDGCLIWQGARSGRRYGAIRVEGRVLRCHRVMVDAQPGDVVMHVCDNPLCVNPEHLRVGTQADNVRDMEEKGRARHPRGEAQGSAKLTEVDVRVIRRLKGQLARKEIAQMFGIAPGYVNHLQARRSWKHV